jgi:transcription factor VIP1
MFCFLFHAALNEALREEVQRLKIAARQAANMNGNPFNIGLQQQIPSYFSQQQQMRYLGGQQAQHHNPNHNQSPSNGDQSLSGQSLNDSMDFV